MREFHIGQLVVLTLDSPGTVGITDGLREFKDKIFPVASYKTVMPDHKKPSTRCSYYTLKGVETKYGIPYAITEDWIVPARRSK